MLYFTSIQDLAKPLKEQVTHHSRTFLLTDTNVYHHCLIPLLQHCPELESAEIIELEPGEENKSIEVCHQIWSMLLEHEADRKALLINIGGGVITDLGGFIASTYKRGIDFIHIPTSLMGQVDAAIGGKTGIDHDGIKNAIGIFNEPNELFICPEFLNSLSDDELISGFAEVMKHALIADPDLWKQLSSLEEITAASLAPFIQRSAKIKADIVAADFKENNIRKNLNFGHTIGHAVESYYLTTEDPTLHGLAVAIGLAVETRLSVQLNLLDQASHEVFFERWFNWFGAYIPSFPDFEGIRPFLRSDKKNEFGTIYPILITAIGSTRFDVAVEEDQLKAAYEETRIQFNHWLIG